MDTNDPTITLAANIGQQAMPGAIGQMEIEFPLIIYSHQFLQFVKSQNITDVTGCTTFYQKNFGMRSAQIQPLCRNSTDPLNYYNVTTFNLYDDPVRSSRAWVNIYLNNHTNEPQDYVDLLLATGLFGNDLNATIHGKGSKVKDFF